jgi:cell division protein ZapA
MDTQKNRVRVNIYGEEYTVRSEGDVKYIQDIAEFVDRKMRDIADKAANKSPARVAILAALNIAGELFQERQSEEGGLSDVEKRANDIISLLDGTLSDTGKE